MGRRKIEIKAIKDDRNRSVTFLKRKGGLFKKAHELSVLCSVDVAVIIFGHNKKLYEFSSGDINETIGRYQYYGGAHEHKGPEDFMGKKDGDDDDDEDDEGAPPRDSHTPPEHAMMQHHMQHSQFQHIRNTAPSMSPPIGNGVPFQQRGPSPQPGHHLSRPNSRAHIRRPSSNLAPPQPYPSQAPPPPNSYAYMPNPPFYNPQAAQHMAPKPQPAPPAPQFQHTYPMPQHPQVQQFIQQEQRRQSMPPALQQQHQQPRHPLHRPKYRSHSNSRSKNVPRNPPSPFHLHPSKMTSKAHRSRNRNLCTPHWGSSNVNPPRSEGLFIKQENRSQSIDVAAMSRLQPNRLSPPQPQPSQVPTQPPQQPPQRTQSTSSMPAIPPPSRTNSLRMGENKPRLRVQIPSEHSDAGSATADSSPKDSGTTGATPGRSTDASHSSGVVLPPPSPSANSLLSAGATGPPNPFARPPPPSNSNSYGSRNDMETPISALPSRFVENGLLPSPSSFYPEWGFGRESNMLPSPLTFQTPVAPNGPSFGRDDSADRKRKTSDGGSDAGSQKRLKA
ncbi:resistance to lethality of mkk1p386 overexpression [Neocucurbitaria cava]|uniref:Resistance to lethality of mkk1p386 overexpression n=1 Tax=Neocucurbitaria cava TaxID=798079 RepID=A0A9W8Y9Q1_9PLEO|nr:resistance to lethality of mkk1p386 overexpression [Neocucurbitaria cava]